MAKKQFSVDTGTIVAIGAGIVIIWGLKGLKKFFNQLGITESKDTTDVNKEAENPNSPWSPNFYLTAKSKGVAMLLLNTAGCEWLYKQIDDAFGVFDDDEAAIKGAIRGMIKTQSQFSFFAWWLSQNKGKDLLDWLRGGAYWDKLEDSDVAEITSYVKGLPKYKL